LDIEDNVDFAVKHYFGFFTVNYYWISI